MVIGMAFNHKAGLLLTVLMLGLQGLGTGKPETFSLPDSTLLFAGDWSVSIVTPGSAEVIPLPTNPEGHKGPSALPTLSANGMLIASGFPVANDAAKKWRVRCAVAVYSRAAKRWKTYGDFSQVFEGAISPDGSKLAFVADTGAGPTPSVKLLLLELESGEITALANRDVGWVSWSPDGRKLAVGGVSVFDLQSSGVKLVTRGSFPAWSPSGAWIAYLGSEQAVRLVHPDGTGEHAVKEIRDRPLSGERSFSFAPVWSPDETKLLLNYYKGANLSSRDVVLLDVATGKTTTKLHNGNAIFGWVSARR